MERHEFRPRPVSRLAAKVGACVAILLAGLSLTRADPRANPDADALEPAKAAVRVKDYAAATRVLAPLAGAGHPEARYLLGNLHLAGLAPAADPARALPLFEAAAEAGNASAAHAVAALLASGEQADPAAARQWLARAAKLGDARAGELVKRGALPLEFRPLEQLPDAASL